MSEEIQGNEGIPEENWGSDQYARTLEALEDGTLLSIYKSMYLDDKSENSMFLFMCTLRDSNGILAMCPTEITMDQADELAESEAAQDMDVDTNTVMMPEFLQSTNGQAWMPVFTSFAELPESYMEDHQFAQGPVLDCIEVAHSFCEMDGIDLDGVVFDPFTDSLEMPFEIADTLKEMPSILQIVQSASQGAVAEDAGENAEADAEVDVAADTDADGEAGADADAAVYEVADDAEDASSDGTETIDAE